MSRSETRDPSPRLRGRVHLRASCGGKAPLSPSAHVAFSRSPPPTANPRPQAEPVQPEQLRIRLQLPVHLHVGGGRRGGRPAAGGGESAALALGPGQVYCPRWVATRVPGGSFPTAAHRQSLERVSRRRAKRRLAVPRTALRLARPPERQEGGRQARVHSRGLQRHKMTPEGTAELLERM